MEPARGADRTQEDGVDLQQVPMVEAGWSGVGALVLFILQRAKYLLVGDKVAVELAVISSRLLSIERWQVDHAKADSAAFDEIRQEFKQINEKLNVHLGQSHGR